MSALRAAIVRALECVEDGDEVLAGLILRDAIENFNGSPFGPDIFCRYCGVGPMWPGPADDHARNVHAGDRYEELAA